MNARQHTAEIGENAVAALLRERGFLIVGQNERAGRYEFDIVAERGRTLVFCEVRTRRSDSFGSPAESVGPSKQKALRAGAKRWLNEHPERRTYAVRFDVAGVLLGNGPLEIDYYVDAF